MRMVEMFEDMAVRILVKRSVVATRGRRRLEGIRQISFRSSGCPSSSKGQVVSVTSILLRFGSLSKIVASVFVSQDVGR